VTRDRYHHLVAAQFCAIHTASGRPDMCDIGRRAADAAVAVLDAHHWPFTDLDHLREITDDAAHAGR
jgi:hypothetical protein